MVAVDVARQHVGDRCAREFLGQGFESFEQRFQFGWFLAQHGRLAGVEQHHQSVFARPDLRGGKAENEIEVAILIRVGPQARLAAAHEFVQPGGNGEAREGFAGLIAVERLFFRPAQEQVGIAIVVEIADARHGAGGTVGQAAFLGDVAIGTAFVVQQQVANLAVLDDGHRQKDVGPTVAIVVQQGHRPAGRSPFFHQSGAAGGLEQVLAGGPAGARGERDL